MLLHLFDLSNELFSLINIYFFISTHCSSSMLLCTYGPNLVVLAWMGDELWCGQDQNGVNLDFQVKFHLEGQGQSSH